MKLPSLACKCIFYRAGHNANDRAQRVGVKNWAIYLYIIFTPMSYSHENVKNDWFSVFHADNKTRVN